MSERGGLPAVARMAPPRFVLFAAVTLLAALGWHTLHAAPIADALVTGFDLGALVFIAALLPLRRDHTAQEMRRHAARNDANRGWVLAITALVSLSLLAAIAAELPAARAGDGHALVKLVLTLALSWCFTNLVFMLHYAHMHYAPDPGSGQDAGGFDFPGTPEPDYRDFLYFAFTAGMSFAASDVDVTRGAVRQIVVAHSLLSFVFNIGVLAFSINVLAGGAS
jgi:uncharacterized membrane protein